MAKIDSGYRMEMKLLKLMPSLRMMTFAAAFVIVNIKALVFIAPR